MSARGVSDQSRQAKSQEIPISTTRVAKRTHTSAPGLKRKDGLLNTTITARSVLMQVAKSNSNQSPLLRLPGELRDKIWRYALGEHLIVIQDLSREEPLGSTADSVYDTRILYPETTVPSGFVRPTFQLPRVCRQIYVEASPYVYTLNTFAFHSMATFDRWIRNRCLGQRRMVASLDAPRTYTRLYRSGFRKTFRSKFPNIQRIGIDNWTLFCDYNEARRLPMNKAKDAFEQRNEAKMSIVLEVKSKEGQHVIVDWHGNSF